MIEFVFYTGFLIVFFWAAGAIIAETCKLVFTSSTSRQYLREEDAWDTVDGGTYVTMQDGTVRLDNNGSLK